MGFVRRGLQLKRGVLDGEMLAETGLERVENLWGVAVVEAALLDDDVRRERREITRDAPRMQIVDFEHVVDRREVATNIGEVEVVGRRFEQDLARVAKQPPRRAAHEHHDDEGRHRVRTLPARDDDDDARDSGADERVEVGHHVRVGAANVEAACGWRAPGSRRWRRSRARQRSRRRE